MTVEQLAPLVLRVVLGFAFVWLMWSLTRTWRITPFLAFPFFPPEVQTLAIACFVLLVIKNDREERAKKDAEFERQATLFRKPAS